MLVIKNFYAENERKSEKERKGKIEIIINFQNYIGNDKTRILKYISQ